MMLGRSVYSAFLAIFLILLAGWFLSRDNASFSSSVQTDTKYTEMSLSLPIATPVPSPPQVPIRPQEQAANNTLGFQKILALSERPSWRTRGLAAAANLTNLDITTPPKPPVDDRLAESFAKIDSDKEGRIHPDMGASKAWLAHLDMVKYIYQSNLQTALILEDDADWDVAIRDQLQNLSTATRQLLKSPESDSTPYGLDWDVLWIGHCGAKYREGEDEFIMFNDAHVCPRDLYKSYRVDDLDSLPEEQRVVFRSDGPVCTYAYALTHRGARKIISAMGAGQGEAFDVEMSFMCQRKELKCIAVVPELVHEYWPPAEFDVKSFVDTGNGEGTGPPEEEFESKKGSVVNIVHSARCQALWHDDCQAL